MSKIICDICGTSYQDTAECCPICGCARGAAADLLGDDLIAEELAEQPKGKGGKVASRKKQIFDYDEVNTFLNQEAPEEEEGEASYDEEEYEEEPRHNTLVVILLTVLIAALLIAAGFIFVRYFLPNLGGDEETVPETTVAQVGESTEATELRIPCEMITVKSGLKAELSDVGFSHLINVVTIPENTTDIVTYVSADQSVATVSEDGKITAVAEGETIVTISCGDVQMFVNVVCDFTPETEPPTEETVDSTEGDDAVEETAGESTDETTDETEAEEESSNKEIDSSIKLKLKKSDISLGVYYQFRLELDCDLDPKDVEWSSEHPYIATVDEEGVVTAVKSGTTAIIAKYGDQEVQCIVRCN